MLVMDPRQLYTLDEAVVAKLKDHRPVLIHQLDGFVDAGQAGRLFSANLLEISSTRCSPCLTTISCMTTAVADPR